MPWRAAKSSGWSTRDEEPLVNGWVDWSGMVVFTSRNVDRARLDSVGGILNGYVGEIQLVLWRLSGDKSIPSFRTFTDNVHSVFLVLALSRESKLVLRLSIWNLIDAEPLISSTQ